MMKNVVIIIEREGKRVESLPIPNRTDIGIFGSFDSTWWWKKRIPFLFFFFIVVVITIDTCYMYACAYLMRCAAQRTNEKNSFVFFLIRFHFCLVVVVIFYLFFCFVSLCFVLWLSFRLENNESRSIHGYFTRHTHTQRERVQMGAFFLQPRPAKKTRNSWRRPRNEKKRKTNFHINKSLVKKSSATKML